MPVWRVPADVLDVDDPRLARCGSDLIGPFAIIRLASDVHKVVDSFASIGLGKGGFWDDRGYEWYAGT